MHVHLIGKLNQRFMPVLIFIWVMVFVFIADYFLAHSNMSELAITSYQCVVYGLLLMSVLLLWRRGIYLFSGSLKQWIAGLFVIVLASGWYLSRGHSISVFPFIFARLTFTAFAEEYIFRGYFYERLTEYGNRWIPVLGSTLIFIIFHLPAYILAQGSLGRPNMLAAGIVGFILALIRYKTNRLILPTAVHLAVDISS
jgi:membrane protease YdiL (CAAX protease family)